MLAVHPVMELIRALPALVGVLILGVSQGGGSGQLVGPVSASSWRSGSACCAGPPPATGSPPTQVQVRRGLLRRSVLTVPRDRVRTVDLTSHFMHRLLGLARVTIGTGQSDRPRTPACGLTG